MGGGAIQDGRVSPVIGETIFFDSEGQPSAHKWRRHHLNAAQILFLVTSGNIGDKGTRFMTKRYDSRRRKPKKAKKSQ